MIRTAALTKRFGNVLAVDGVDLDVREGDRYGFLGPNGSGKTTTIRMILGLVYPTSGEIEVLGKPAPKQLASVLPKIGALVEGPAAYPHLSGRANLALLDAAGPGAARRTRGKRIEEALKQVGLAGVGRRPVKAYSLGMRQRLGLAAALLKDPDLLVLDEPANGLDPAGIREVRHLLRRLGAEGRGIWDTPQANRTQWMGGRSRLTARHDWPALSERKSAPVVVPIASTSPVASTSRPWR